MTQHNDGDERGLLAALSLADKVRLLTGADNWSTGALPAIRLGPIVFSDGPAGVRGTAMDERHPSASLPCPSALGATWDTGLVSALAFALGTEARSKGVDVLLAPTINVMRTPLGGRGFESFGEDPVLIARLAVAYVAGLRQAGVAAAVKHFVGNDSETQRWTYDARIAEHVLHELYLAPFEACVCEADVDLVMTGYNRVNGTSMTEHAALLSGVLKGQWGFAGVALSDWHAARSTVATAAAGLDLAMPGPYGPWGDKLTAAVLAGEVTEAEVDDKVRRVLRLARRVGALAPAGPAGPAPDGHAPVLADPRLLRRAAATAFTLLRNDRTMLPLDPGAMSHVAVIGPNAVSPVTQGGGSATVNPVSVSTPAAALAEALDGQVQVTVRPGCTTWSLVPEPPRAALRDPETGEQGVRLEFRGADGTLLHAEHRTTTAFTWWEGLPDGIGRGDRGTIVLRAAYRALQPGRHLIGGGGVGRLTVTVDGAPAAAGRTAIPADPVEPMIRPGEVRAAADLAEGQEAEIAVSLLPEDWPQGPVAIRLGIVPEPDADAMLDDAVKAARDADAAIVVVGSGPATESEGFDRPGLALPGRQDELVRRVAEVNDRTVVVVNAGMPVLMPWADEVAAVGYAWLPGQAMGEALADVLLGVAEPGGRLPVTIPRAESDCPVLHSVPADGRLSYAEGLLIGYRGYDRAGTVPHFAFGHGLGYTTWEYESATAGSAPLLAESALALTVMVRNTGGRAGREVVQAYVEPPVLEPGRPVRTLAAFTTVTAEPGRSAEARLAIPARAFARYDEASRDWVLQPGEFTVRIGRSSADLRLSVRVRSGLSRCWGRSPMPSGATENFLDAASVVPGNQEVGFRSALAASAVLIYAAIRVLALAVAALLLHHGRFRALHWSLVHMIVSWDSDRYLIIAAHGYAYVPGYRHPESILATYPGYPLAIDTIAWIPGIGLERAGFAVTIAAGLAAAWGLTRLGMALTGDRRLSLVMVAAWAVAPASIVLSMLYSEALFCALAIWSLVALVERRWLTAAVLTIGAGLVRTSTSVALVAAVAVAASPTVIAALRARQPAAAWWRPAAALLLSPLGGLGYWAYSAVRLGHLGGIAWLEKNGHDGFDWGQGVFLAVKEALFDHPSAIVVMTLVVLAAAVVLTICSLTERFPWSVHVYTLAIVVIALGVGPLYLGSKPRFLLPAMLLSVPVARLLAPLPAWLLGLVIGVLGAASVWFSLFLMTAGWAP